MAAWTDGHCSNCGAMMPTGGCPFCVRKTLIVTTTGHTEYDDHRDAEIARLKAEVTNQRHEIGVMLGEIARLRAALAAGPAALREMAEDYDRKVINGTVPSSAAQSSILRSADLINAALHVEAAQEAAMKEKP